MQPLVLIVGAIVPGLFVKDPSLSLAPLLLLFPSSVPLVKYGGSPRGEPSGLDFQTISISIGTGYWMSVVLERTLFMGASLVVACLLEIRKQQRITYS